MKRYLLLCLFISTINLNQSIGQCLAGLSPNLGFLDVTSCTNCQSLTYCGITDGAWIGNGSTPGTATYSFIPPTSYVEVDFNALSTTAAVYEYLEFWVNGAFYDLNDATATFTTGLPGCNSATVSFVTSPGNLGNSGISGVIEALADNGSGTVKIDFGCELNTIEIKNQNVGASNGSVLQVRRCLDNATGNGNCTCNLATTIVSTNIACNSGATGAASALATNGTLPYTYNWSNGSNTASINGLSAGTYTVTITDAAGCIETNQAIITETNRFDILFTVSNVGCDSLDDGEIIAVNDGGAPPFTYQWNVAAGNQTTATISNMGVGTYKVTMTDTNGCTSAAGVVLKQIDCPPPCPSNPCVEAILNNTDICSALNSDPTDPLATLDCDGDGVTNADECSDGTDPLDPCDFEDTSITLPVTADQSGCPMPCPDLTPTTTVIPGNIAGMSAVEVAVQISELDSVDTNGSIVVVRMPSDPRLIFVWNIGLTQAALVSVQNSDWNYLGDNGFVHTWTYNGPGLIIKAGGVTAFGFQSFYDPQSTAGQTTLTATIVPFSGGECTVTNNSDSERLVYFE